MCLLNYTKKKKKYKHITYTERTMIETWYNSDKKSKKEIADLLHKSERTIRREIARGMVVIRGYNWEDKKEYSSQIAQEKYDDELKAKGQQLKIGSDIKLINKIEKEIKENKKSPEAIVYELTNQGELIKITARTIRNYIKAGDIFGLSTVY